MKRIAGYALKGLAFFLGPLGIGLVIATVKGWRGLAASPRLVAGWGLLLAFALVLPLFLARAGRAAMGHEPAEAARVAWRTGIAALVLGVLASLVVPWRELGEWIAATLSDLTGVPILVPERAQP